MVRFLFSVLVSTLVSVADAGTLKGADGKENVSSRCRLGAVVLETDADSIAIFRSVGRSKRKFAATDDRSSPTEVVTPRSVCFFVKE